MLKDFEVTEALGGVASEMTGTRLKVRLIEGDRLGSSAYYPADVLATYGPKVFTRGTPMFINHQTADEKQARPFGSIHDFVGELAEDAYYENDGLYAEVEVFEDAAPTIKARKDRIGLSVRAMIEADEGVINGRKVPIAKKITSARSVDFVMKAGAGGKIVSILESAIEEAPEGAEEGETMEKVLEAIEALDTKFSAKFADIEGKLVVEESATSEDESYAKALEIAEAFINSSLDAEGRSRVLDLHKANGKPLADLIAAEEAYVKAHNVEESAEDEGVEDEGVEAEESATTKITVPTIGAWGKK